ncbi:hypothetical protein BRD01_02105 [Halobacteriales archaeon QS_8_65_32]|jgi:hypothetical protein|nr:MAG: hypothetical protein BRD01_02105 [Halobacteriales archaeon QS_8_65_32]
MNWNDSYGGSDEAGGTAGENGAGTENRALRSNAKTVATRVRDLLPAEYDVQGDVTESASGSQALVAIQPPVGPAITAGFGIDEYADANGTAIPDDERDEVASGLAARAALQVKQAVGDALTPTAR